MLALLQRLLTFALIALAVSCWFYFRSSSPLLAIAGCLLILFGYAGLLGLEFIILQFVNQSDPVPKPGWTDLFRAWLGETWVAPQVFCWRQPFRAKAIADNVSPMGLTHGLRGVVFVHGFFCNRGLWNPWLKRLQGQGHAFVAVNLEPLFGSIDDYVPQIDKAVRQVTLVTGLPPLLVCHSMGGLAARAWLQAMKSEERVHHILTIGTPHRGTWLARFGHGKNGRQMRLLSDWQSQLDHQMPADRHALFTCWYSNCDNIVFPTSTATLPGADNRLVRGAAHVQMAFLPEIMDATLATLRKS
jgi:pimeloyl-ACP methyl ester carboxylesterase